MRGNFIIGFKEKMENNNLSQKLKDWRMDQARKENVELFRVLSNLAIETIAAIKPKTKEELMSIKGIKEKKFDKYGLSILALVREGLKINESDTQENVESFAALRGKDEEEKPYTINSYLNFLNAEFKKYKARIQGEVSSLDIKDNYLFFTLKDKNGESVLPCFMWKNNYELCGVSLEIGREIIVDGFPEIYAPSGRFTFKVAILELVGEGELKKAYEKLKQKLEKEGLFSPEIKKPIPEFPRKIGLITSETGAVIHDFLNNLGKYGFHISFVNARVEGQAAVSSLLSAIEYFNDKDIDVLVIIRGGGSLESLQAFNNETLVRKIAEFKAPVICGIGHDKDVPLASLVADKAVSTPTAVTIILNKTWEKIINDIFVIEKDAVYKYQRVLDAALRDVESFSGDLARFFKGILQNARKTQKLFFELIFDGFQREFENKSRMLDDAEKQLRIFDPARQLRLGYSIVSISGKVVKTVKQVKIGERLNIKVSDGNIKSVINSIN